MNLDMEEIKLFFGKVFVGLNATLTMPYIKKKVKGHTLEVSNWKIDHFKVRRYDLNHDVKNHFLTFIVAGVTIISTLEVSISNKLFGRSRIKLESKIKNMKYLVALQTNENDIKKMHSKINLQFDLETQKTEKKLKSGLLSLVSKLGINSFIEKTMKNKIDVIFSDQFIKFMKKNLNIGEPPKKIEQPKMDPMMNPRAKGSPHPEENWIYDPSAKPNKGGKNKRKKVNPKNRNTIVSAAGILSISGRGSKMKNRLDNVMPHPSLDADSKMSRRERRRTANTTPKGKNPLPNRSGPFQKKNEEEEALRLMKEMRKPPPPDEMMGAMMPSVQQLQAEIACYKEIISESSMKQQIVEENLRKAKLQSLHFFLLTLKFMNRGKKISVPEMFRVHESMQVFDEIEMKKRLQEFEEYEKTTKTI